jgi:putative intracellular protease/amidase
MTPPTFRIVFALYPDVTQLDFTGPHQVFCRMPGVEVIVASANATPIAVDGLTFSDLTRLGDIDRCDMICVPGGFGTSDALGDVEFMTQVKRLGDGARYVTSVCTGSLVLGAAGFLKGRRAACHWAWRDLLADFGAIPDPARVVRDGHVITGGGVTAGIDFALTISAEIGGETLAQALQLNLEYAPQPPFNAGRPDTAPAEIVALVESRMKALSDPRRAAVRDAARALALAD